MAKKEKIITVRNRLLGAFESASRERVDPYIERAEVTLGDIVCEAGGILNHAYFPDGAAKRPNAPSRPIFAVSIAVPFSRTVSNERAAFAYV